MKRIILALIILILASLACGRASREPAAQPPTLIAPTDTASLPPTPVPVPAAYGSLYTLLAATLDAVQHDFPGGSGAVPVFAAELSYANGNVGEALLSPAMLPLVRQQLDGFSRLGVTGVTLAVKFPLVEPGFPRSAEYLQFFKLVADEVRARHMKLLVESGALFSGTVFSSVKVDWSQYPTIDAFRNAEIHQLQTIAREIHPDYLQIANEPTTTAELTKFLDTPMEYAAFVARAVQAIPPQSGMAIGAGAGTWEDQAYVTKLYSIPGLDFIDLHVYPLGRNGNMLRLAATEAQGARAAGKRVVISEAWLYKTDTSNGFQSSDFTTVIGRDVFSFWEPLDEKFIVDLTNIARASGIEFVSFFWVRAFYAYLDYAQYSSVPLDQVNPIINKAAAANLQQGLLSPLGQFFENWVGQQK